MAPTVTVKAKARAFELACNSANVTFSRASDAAVAQQALNGKSLLRADALKVTLISGGGRREDYDPEHDSDDMARWTTTTRTPTRWTRTTTWRTTTERLAARCVDGTVAV